MKNQEKTEPFPKKPVAPVIRKVFPLRNLTMPMPSSCISTTEVDFSPVATPFELKTKLPASINESVLTRADVSVRTDEIPVDFIA